MAKIKPQKPSSTLLGIALFLSVLSTGTSLITLNKVQGNPASAITETESYYATLEPAFVVNFAKDSKHYMQITVAVMAHDEDKLKQFSRHFPALRDKLVMLFAGYDFEVLQTKEGKEELRQKATKYAQELAISTMGNKVIEQVLFTNMVLQ